MHPLPLKILKFNKHITLGITCGISPGNTSTCTENGQELTIHEENIVMHIQTNLSLVPIWSRGDVICQYNAEPQMTVLGLAKV